MRKQYFLATTCIVFSFFLGFGQILTVVEKNSDRTEIIDSNGPQIIDINSNLEISISKSALIEKIRIIHPDFGDQLDLQVRIDALSDALDNQETILNLLKQETLNKSDKKSLYKGLIDFYKILSMKGNEDIRFQVNGLYNEWSKKYGSNSISPNSAVKKEVYIYSNLNSNLAIAKQNLRDYRGKFLMLSMMAFVHDDLGKNKVHVENFDIITESDIYEVPRWVTSLSKDQEEQLKQLQKRAEDYNKQVLNYFENLKVELLSKLPDLSCIKTLKTEIEAFISDPSLSNDIKLALENDVKAIINQINGLDEFIGLVTQDISKWKIDTPFKIIDGVKLLDNNVKKLGDVFNNFKNTAQVFNTIRTKLTEFSTAFNTCYKSIEADINGLISGMSILKNQQKRFKDNDDISDDVKKFTLNNLPEKGYIKLKRSGPRKTGDDLEVVLVLRFPSDETSSSITTRVVSERNEVIESHFLNMQLIGLRSETSVGIIMADSFDEKGFTPVEDRRFLYAPSIALLLKVGSRNSKLYNDFVDFGFGLAVSTPDFNTDGTPEFGVGLVLTAFKDILSLGINYNVTLDTPYWSFGINLPFNLPGIPINKPN